MADNKLLDLNQFEIRSYEEARAVIRDVELEFLILWKKIRKLYIDYKDLRPERIYSRLKKFGKMLTDAFQVDSWEDYTQAAAIFGTELADSLYQTQLGFSGLKIAVLQAAAPFVQVLLPVVQLAVKALTGLAQSIGYVFRTLFFGTEEVQEYSTAVQGAATSSRQLKKTLAGFDQINRLNGSSGGFLNPGTLSPISSSWKKMGDKLLELFEPLKRIDLTPAAESLERLKKALEPITKALFEGLEWAWYNIFVPLAEWTAEELLPVFLDTLTAALEALGRIIEELRPHFDWLWENCLKPWAEWKGSQFIAQLQGIQDELNGVSGWITTQQGPVDKLLSSGMMLIDTLAAMTEKSMGLSATTDGLTTAYQGLLSFLIHSNSPLAGTALTVGTLTDSVSRLSEAFRSVTESSDGTWSAMKDAWGQMKEKLLDPTYRGVKDTLNGTIGLLNGMLDGATGGVNFLTKAMNKLSFTIPDWIPLIGGKSFSFYAKPLQAPKIPYLAKGAVLPANRPFMAVVGDQRHGTNIEAPLATIQEAMALVMEDYAASNLAGHQATVTVLRELLAAVLGISVGDDMLAAAVDRYHGKLSMVHGGYL